VSKGRTNPAKLLAGAQAKHPEWQDRDRKAEVQREKEEWRRQQALARLAKQYKKD